MLKLLEECTEIKTSLSGHNIYVCEDGTEFEYEDIAERHAAKLYTDKWIMPRRWNPTNDLYIYPVRDECELKILYLAMMYTLNDYNLMQLSRNKEITFPALLIIEHSPIPNTIYVVDKLPTQLQYIVNFLKRDEEEDE